MALKFSVQEHLVPGDSLVEKWQRISAMGYDGIELHGLSGHAFRDRLPELRAARRAGAVLPSVCVITDRFIGDFDAGRRAEALATMKMLLSVIAEIGGTGAITPASYGMHSAVLPPFKAPRPPEDDHAILCDMLGQLGLHAASEGVTVYFEPLNRYEDHMVNTLAQGAAICRAVGLPSVRLMADLFHMSIEERDLAAALRGAGDLVAHVHLADSNRREPGRGHTDFAASFAALKEIGFDGFCALECGLDLDPEASLRGALAALRAAEGRP
jgi:sugar phosphate isomerase/epimerase